MTTIDVLLVDDHAVVRAGYRRFLERDSGIRVVAEAEDAGRAFEAFCLFRPHVTVIDLGLPGEGGLELVRRLMARDASAALLVFSMHEEAIYAVRALQAGARGYVTKSSDPEALVQAVRQVQEGRVALSPDIARKLVLHGSDPMAVLSGREFEIFRLLAQGRPVAEIAELLGLSQKTIANQQTQIKEKLGVPTVAGLVHVALRYGVIAAPV